MVCFICDGMALMAGEVRGGKLLAWINFEGSPSRGDDAFGEDGSLLIFCSSLARKNLCCDVSREFAVVIDVLFPSSSFPLAYTKVGALVRSGDRGMPLFIKESFASLAWKNIGEPSRPVPLWTGFDLSGDNPLNEVVEPPLLATLPERPCFSAPTACMPKPVEIAAAS